MSQRLQSLHSSSEMIRIVLNQFLSKIFNLAIMSNCVILQNSVGTNIRMNIFFRILIFVFDSWTFSESEYLNILVQIFICKNLGFQNIYNFWKFIQIYSNLRIFSGIRIIVEYFLDERLIFNIRFVQFSSDE